jgi:diadenosine tetraphosphatase ApaH/serine/threonine PP2A family protein phosphatase
MKLALFADVHSNLEALTACLEHAKPQGADRYAFLGDLVGYGADPAAVLDLVEDFASKGAVVVLGNHDAAVIGKPAGPLNRPARSAALWTRSQLNDRQLAFLAGLALCETEDDVCFVHASAAAPERWTYVDSAVQAARSMRAGACTYTFCGHVHEQVLYYLGASGRPMPFRPVPGTPIPLAKHRAWLAIVGSAGQPRDGNNNACYAVADLDRARITFHRVPYDYASAARKILAAGLPQRFALRLGQGE